jgi:predicted RNA binding protein YcfA (HicA-like mRNA interferase family)
MSTIPVLKARAVETILQKLGFSVVRQKGSHKQFRHSDGRGTTVPFHPGQDISPILLKKIAADINMTLKDFLKYH